MKNILGLAILLVLAFSAYPALADDQDCAKCPRLISVTGEAEIRVVPTEVFLSFGIDTSAKTLALAKAQHDERGKKVQALLRDAGIDSRDIQTSSLSMGPEYEETKDKYVQVGYEVKQSLSVLLRDLTKYESVMSALLEAGVNRVDGVQFRTSDMRKYRDEARVLAIRAAREKATALAGELNQKLGKPHSITEENLNAPSRQAGTANTVVGVAMNYVQEDESTIPAGQLVIRAKIYVQFELQD